MKKEQQKISFKIYKNLLDIINAKFELLPIGRDAFLNNVIFSECHRLEKELSGKPALSTKANRYISAQLNDPRILKEGVKQLNIVVNKDTADYLNKIVSDKNLVRDAFLNRVFLYLVAPPNMFTWFDEKMDKTTEFWKYDELDAYPVSPLDYVSQVLSSPFALLVRSFEKAGVLDEQDGIYLCRLPDKYTGFTCFMNDSEVPGTDEYAQEQAAIEEMLKSI